MGFSVPVIKFAQVSLLSKKELKGGHYKLNFSDSLQNHKIDGLMFSPSERLKGLLTVGNNYQILTELQWNYYNGKKTIQLLVKDLKLLC